MNPAIRALLRDHAARRDRTVDDHMFSVATDFVLPATMRLQVFTAPAATPVMVAIQNTGEGPSLTNAAETYFAAAWQRHCPDQQRPPIWVQRQILPGFDSFDLVSFEEATPYTAARPQWCPLADDVLARLVGGPVDRGRGDRYEPRPPEPEPERHYCLIPAAHLPRPHPFRQACMPSATPQARRNAGQLAPDPAPPSCCWYHGGDWTTATEAAAALLHQAQTEGLPDDELTSRIIELADQADLPPWQREAIESLITDPISLTGDGRRYINGQHRAQAILDQRSPQVLVTEYLDPPDRAEAEAALTAWLTKYGPHRP